jgi:hypothetical protein
LAIIYKSRRLVAARQAITEPTDKAYKEVKNDPKTYPEGPELAKRNAKYQRLVNENNVLIGKQQLATRLKQAMESFADNKTGIITLNDIVNPRQFGEGGRASLDKGKKRRDEYCEGSLPQPTDPYLRCWLACREAVILLAKNLKNRKNLYYFNQKKENLTNCLTIENDRPKFGSHYFCPMPELSKPDKLVETTEINKIPLTDTELEQISDKYIISNRERDHIMLENSMNSLYKNEISYNYEDIHTLFISVESDYRKISR